MTVATATGPIEPDALGLVLVHEHLRIGWPGSELDRTRASDRRRAIQRCVDLCRELVELGVDTIVDPCPMDLGRDVEFAAEVSRESGLRIIVATGLYTEALGQPYYFHERSVEELTEIFTGELTEGVGTTGIRPGVVKCAAGATAGLSRSGSLMTEQEEKVHRAAARASIASGVPIFTHTDELAPAGREQLKIFSEEGVQPDRILIGHCGGSGNLRYLFKLIEGGASVGFDRFGVETLCPDRQRLAAMVGLISTGHTDRLFVSSDMAMTWVGAPSPAMLRIQERCPSWNAAHVVRDVLPALAEMGVSQDELDTITRANPRRLLTPSS